ncbi:hypothetical protein [Acinetobacter baumannii]|uniref:hypothetical protein n=1 Tax=Acinetobacter baumannii TaxID=470 RepID=UPI00333533E2
MRSENGEAGREHDLANGYGDRAGGRLRGEAVDAGLMVNEEWGGGDGKCNV